MRHAKVENWAQGVSPIHQLHPTAKIATVLVTLVVVSTQQHHAVLASAAYLIVLAGITKSAKLPVGQLALTAAGVLPLAASFALISAFAGQRDRALFLLTRSYVSSYAALLLIATTPMPSLISGLETLRIPRFLLLVMQFLYRYLVVLFEEAGAIRDAGASRGGTIRTLQFQQAGAAAGVLFSRAFQRANAIYQAMLARGFEGSIPTLTHTAFVLRDALFVALVAGTMVAIWIFSS